MSSSGVATQGMGKATPTVLQTQVTYTEAGLNVDSLSSGHNHINYHFYTEFRMGQCPCNTSTLTDNFSAHAFICAYYLATLMIDLFSGT